MKPVTIYTKPGCPYCVRAMEVLQEKGAEIVEIVASEDPIKREEMLARSHGRRTYPQIFIGDEHIGSCDDMMMLNYSGRLDEKLAD